MTISDVMESGDSSLNELESIKSLLVGSEPVLWLFAGDSITHGAVHTFGWRSYVEHFSERIRTEMNRKRDLVINSGVNGWTSGQLLEDLDHLVLRFAPDVVSIMIGMNDAAEGPDGRRRFEANYNRLLERLRAETKAHLIVQTPNPITRSEPLRQDLPAYIEIMLSLARRYETAIIDQFALWNRHTTPLESLLEDGLIHPNHYGHVVMAHHMFEALGIWERDSSTCCLFIP